MMHKSLIPLLVVALLSSTASSQQTEKIPVTLDPYSVAGNPDASRLPDLSTTASTLDASDLDHQPGRHFQDLLSRIPNLSFAGGSNRARFLQIRGIGERSQFAFEGPPNYSVGMLVDDIDVSGIGGLGDLFDVSEVEVLRGPQAAIYGSRALAGLVHIRTEAPSPVTSGLVEIGAGTDELFRVGLALGGPVTETLSFRASIHHHQQNGFHDAVFLDREDTNGRDERTARVKLRWDPSANWRTDLTMFHVDHKNGYDVWAPDNNRDLNTYSDRPGKDAIDAFGVALRNTWMGPETSRLLSITTWSEADLEYSYDGDWGNDAFWRAAPYNFDPAVEGYANDFFDKTLRTRRTITQDFRWISEPDGRIFGDTTAWHLGLYGSRLHEKDDYDGFGQLQSDYRADSVAGYTQLTTELNPTLHLVTSGRVEWRDTDYSDDQGINATDDETMVGGRIALEQQLNDTWLGFAAVSRGYKGSGVNQDAALPSDKRFYNEETVWNFEVGTRAAALDGRWRADLTAFWMERRDLQISTSFQADPTDPTSFAFFTDNAAKGRNLGLEAEVEVQLGDRLTWFTAAGLLNTEFTGYDTAGGTNSINGREQPYAPSYTFLTGLAYRHAKGWFARVELEGKDAFYYSDSHDQQSSNYELLHLAAGWQGDAWSFTLWGRNVLDERYAVRAFQFGLEPPAYEDTLYKSYGDPAQAGLSAQYRF